MAKVVYANGIDYASGSFSKPVKKAGHVCGTYLIGKHRKAATSNPNCTSIFIQKADTYDRVGMPGANELLARQRFAAVRAAVQARKEDMTKVDQDQADFLAQRDLPGGKVTMNAYLWKVCGDIYDAAHPQG